MQKKMKKAVDKVFLRITSMPREKFLKLLKKQGLGEWEKFMLKSGALDMNAYLSAKGKSF